MSGAGSSAADATRHAPRVNIALRRGSAALSDPRGKQKGKVNKTPTDRSRVEGRGSALLRLGPDASRTRCTSSPIHSTGDSGAT